MNNIRPKSSSPSALQNFLVENKNSEPVFLSKNVRCFIYALIGGFGQQVSFNWWDRALFLRQKEKRPFFHRENFRNPYQGFWQSVTGRSLSSGIYFPLNDYFRGEVCDVQFGKGALSAFLAGNSAGTVSAFSLNWMTVVKYRCWGTNKRFWPTLVEIYTTAGFRPFFNGILPTIARDATFGGCFGLLKWMGDQYAAQDSDPKSKKIKEIFVTFTASGIATMFASPFNFARNACYALSPQIKEPWTHQTLKALYAEASTTPHPIRYLANRLGIGIGTLRVMSGMALGHEIYRGLQSHFEPLNEKN